ncbi:MAG TPA: alpha/beta hydrolase [Phycisphaerales bacterium]|nr:alpha/beta hydrolase [Phycisphaerales bacterium]
MRNVLKRPVAAFVVAMMMHAAAMAQPAETAASDARAVMPASSAAGATPTAQAEPSYTKGIVYATRTLSKPGAEQRDADAPEQKLDQKLELKLDLALPARAEGDTSLRPCVVVIHGGGWAGGRREDVEKFAKFFASREGGGHVAAAVSYRLAPQHAWPAQIVDCADAVRFLRNHASEYGIDPSRIGAMGFSAGAHLAMMLAVGDAGDGLGIELAADDPVTIAKGPQPSAKVQAAVSVVGPVKLDAADISPEAKQIVDTFLQLTPQTPAAERTAKCQQASPLTYVSNGDAPMLLFLGTADPLIPPTQGPLMAEAMAKHGVPGRVETIVGAGHGWGGVELQRTLAATLEFFGRAMPPSATPVPTRTKP